MFYEDGQRKCIVGTDVGMEDRYRKALEIRALCEKREGL
jgi:hypothetical protein